MKRQTVVLLGAALYIPLVVYPPLRLISWFFGDLSNITWFVLLLLFAILFPTYISRSVRSSLSRPISVFLMTFYCLMFQLCVIVLPLEFLRIWVNFSDQTLAYISLAGWSVLAIASLFGALHISVHRLPISSKNDTQGKSLVQISDVHIGTRRPAFLRRIVKKIAKLNPDAILITGDLVDAKSVNSSALSPLAELKAPVFFCTGNHERQEHCEDIVRWLQDHNVKVLRNESFDLRPFQLIGLEDQDSAEQISNALNELEPRPDRFRVLLCHKPEGMENAASWGVDLMLSGHTHHGQVFPFGYIVKRAYDPYRGLHTIGQMTLYISSGTGTTGPLLRVGTRNEITQLMFV